MNHKFAVQWFVGKKENFRVFEVETDARKFFADLDSKGLIASWGDYVTAPFKMFLVSGQSAARKEQIARFQLEAQKLKAARATKAAQG